MMATKRNLNHCDHGHTTWGEIRRLPISGQGMNQSAVLVCRGHYEDEMEYRRVRARDTGRDKWDWPTWDSLNVEYAEVPYTAPPDDTAAPRPYHGIET